MQPLFGGLPDKVNSLESSWPRYEDFIVNGGATDFCLILPNQLPLPTRFKPFLEPSTLHTRLFLRPQPPS